MFQRARLALVLGISAYAVGTAAAQAPGSLGRIPDLNSMLAANKQLQEELKLGKEQIEQIMAAVEQVHADLKDDIATLLDPDKPREELVEAIKKVSKATAKALGGILKPEQTKRLDQIRNQLDGIHLFENDKVQKALEFTKEQTAHIKATIEKTKDKRRLMAMVQAAYGSSPELREKMQALNKEALESITKTFSEPQKKAYKDLVGEPFTLKPEASRSQPATDK
jgi:hypothetical protein